MDDCTKVLVYGSFDGFARSTDSSLLISVVLDGGEKVEIPEEFIVSADQMVNKYKIKLKDVIARIEKFDLATKAVWINEILNELGSEYGAFKYKAGYEQGKFDGAMEHEKVTIPQFVADWVEYCKENHLTITGAFEPVSEHGIGLAETFKGSAYKCTRWALDNQNLFARAWLDGYEVEKEKRYWVNVKGMQSSNFLNREVINDIWYMGNIVDLEPFTSRHTRKELEEAGFGWVFDCPGIEIEEVEE